MSINKNIHTFGDGFATGHIWPEWPQMLQAILYDCTIKNHSGIGAGNEFIFSNLVGALTKDPLATYIVQWAQPDRFDKLIEDTSWDNIIKNDQIYRDNVIEVGTKRWWPSSASSNLDIRTYHNFYVQSEQAKLRSFNYIWAGGQCLKNAQHCFFGTYDFGYLTDEQRQCLDFNWAFWRPWKGLENYSHSAEFDTTRLDEIQPSPIVHFEWVINYVLPKINVDIDTVWLDILKQRLYNQTWIPYNPDQNIIWDKLKERK